MKKFALFSFNGDPMCFIHVLLNALELNVNGHEVKVIIEGASTKLIPELTKQGSILFPLYHKAKSEGLIKGVCKACANKMGTLEAAKAEGFQLLDDMSGHPSMAGFINLGYEIITF